MKAWMTSLIVSVASTNLIASEQGPPAESIRIIDLQVNGTGCPIDSVIKNISPQGEAFTLQFFEFLAEIGPGISRKESRQSCQVTLQLKHPRGWRFGLVAFEYRGFADIDPGVYAEHESNYYFQGQPDGKVFKGLILGPKSDGFQILEEVAPSQVYWSSCDTERAINIKTSLSLRRKSGADSNESGTIGTDSLDGTIKSQKWRLSWERCEVTL